MMRPCGIDRNGEVWKYQPGLHKTTHLGRERIIYIRPQAQGILRRYLARDPQAFLLPALRLRSQAGSSKLG
jgi:hypothetical protein